MALRNTNRGLFFLSLLILTPLFGDTNILINPDFEKGIEGWSGRSCQIEAVSSIAHSGLGCARAFDRTDRWQGISQSILGKMVTGKTYHISGWVRLENAPSDTVIVSIDLRDDSGNKYPNVARVTATDKDWTLVSGDFTLTAEGTISGLDVYFEGPAPGVNFYVDDVNVFGPEAETAIAKVSAKPVEPNATSIININKVYQKIEGFGAAGAYYTMEFVSHHKKEELHNALFKELGIEIFRIRNNYDMEANSFRETVEIVKGAKAINNNLKIMLSSWSPPARLKSNSNTVGGTLRKVDGKYDYDGFAQWWLDSLKAYADAGVKIDYINIQNEPDYEAKWDSCRFEPTETAEFAGYDAAFEAVWKKLNENMGQDMPKMLAPESYGPATARRYVEHLDDLTHVYGYAYHLYDCPGSTSGCGTEPDKYLPHLENFKSKFGDKPILQTEYQHKEPDNWQQAINTALLMHNTLTASNAAGYLYWDLFWGAGTVSLISLDNPESYTINPVYYAFKHFSAFTDAGWQRVETSTENTGLRLSAFISPDNKNLTVIIINISNIDIMNKLSFEGFAASAGSMFLSSRNEKCVLVGEYKDGLPIKLPAKSIITLTIGGSKTEI